MCLKNSAEALPLFRLKKQRRSRLSLVTKKSSGATVTEKVAALVASLLNSAAVPITGYGVIFVEKILSVTCIALSIISLTCTSVLSISFDFVNTNILNARSTFVSNVYLLVCRLSLSMPILTCASILKA